MLERAQELVTVFGGSGFIGRYVCEMLLKSGVRVRVAGRNPRGAYFIQPLGHVGQLGFVRADITKAASAARAVAGARAVINLPGVLKGRFEAVHVTGARHVAEAARDAGAAALVHISAIGADAQSQSAYGRSKGEGEAAVRAAFPTATIIRPSLVFGPEDQLTNRFAGLAGLPFLPVIAPRTRFQPVYVRDLANTIAKAALDPGQYGCSTYEIGGPRVMTMRELTEAILEASGQATDLVDMPDFAASMLSRFGFLPGAPLTRDQWLMLQSDNVVAPGALGLEAFGIRPTPLGAVAHEWLSRFHKGGRFAGRPTHQTASH
ncbi:MAG: complex I NDUFA9 subunit family protein [Sphingomicrobium sp.]